MKKHKINVYATDLRTEKSIYDVLIKKYSIKEAIIKTKFKNLYLIAGTINLAGLEIDFEEMKKQENNFVKGEQLKTHLEEIKDDLLKEFFEDNI